VDARPRARQSADARELGHHSLPFRQSHNSLLRFVHARAEHRSPGLLSARSARVNRI
jgi:hypothetical protein